jgi:hypothetical protein
MQRLRPLSEAECYARLYGPSGESYVTVIDIPRRIRSDSLFGVNGEDLRRRFEELLDEREPDPLATEDAA